MSVESIDPVGARTIATQAEAEAGVENTKGMTPLRVAQAIAALSGGLQNNLVATTAPGASNDNTEGYSVGSFWIDVTGDDSYRAVDVSTGAAVWILTTLQSSDLATVALSGDYDDLTNKPSTFTPSAHAGSHTDGSDDIRDATAAQSGLMTAAYGAKLDGIAAGADVTADNAPQAHASSHERGGSDEVDGDHLDIDFTPSNYTPSTSPAEAAHVDDLAAHLAGIDDAIGSPGGGAHASTHESGGADPIKLDDLAAPDDNTDLDATGSAHGLMPKADKSKLDGIESSATADQSDAEIESAYNTQVPAASQAEAEAGTGTSVRRFTPERVKQAIAALPPATHASSHQSGGGDAIKLDDLSAPDDNTDLDATGSAHGLMPKASVTKLAGIATGADVTADNAPQAHASSHQSGGGDAIKLDDLSAPDDNTDLDATGSAHGLMPKASVTKLAGIATGADVTADNAPQAHASSHQSGGGDAIKLDDLSAPDDNTDLDVSTSAHGLVPKAPNDAAQVLLGDGTWGLPSQVSINTQTDSYQVVLGDAGKYVRMNKATANNLTIPPNATVAFPTGTTIHVRQVGAGQTTIVEGSGVTVNTGETLLLRQQGSTAVLIKVATNEWDLAGDLEEA